MGIVKTLKLTRRRSRELVGSLLLAGVFPTALSRTGFDFRKYAWTAFCIFSFSYVIVFTLYNLVNLQTNNFMVKVSTVKTSVSAFMCLVMVLVTMYKCDHLTAVIKFVESNFYTYPDEHRFRFKFSVAPRSEKLFMYSMAFIFLAIYCAAVLSHLIYLLFNPSLLQSKGKMLTNTWVPFRGDTVFSYYMAHLFLFGVTFPVAVTIVGNMCFLLHLYLEFRNQFERLAYSLNTIVQRIEFIRTEISNKAIERNMSDIELSSVDGSELFTDRQAKMFDRQLIECLRHYRVIRRCFHQVGKWFGVTYSIILAHSVLTLAMMLYGALLNIKSIGVCVKYAAILTVYTGQVYVYCFTGDRIYDLNENLANVLCGVPWYRQPAKNRKIFFLFLCEIQRPFRLLGIKIYPASLNVFSGIMKLSYSYLNLLRTYGSSFRKS